MTVSRRIFGWFLVTVAVLILVATSVYRSMTDLIDQGRLVDRTHAVLVALHDVTGTLHELEAEQRGFLLTGQQEHLDRYFDGLAAVGRDLEGLRRLTADTPAGRDRLERLEDAVDRRLDANADVLEASEREGLDRAQALMRASDGRREMGRVEEAIRALEAEERRRLVDRQEATEAAARATISVGGACFAGCLGILATLFGLVRREGARRRRTEASLQRANARLGAMLRDLEEHTREAALVAALGDYLQSCRSPGEAYGVLSRIAGHLLPDLLGSVAITSHSRTLVETVAHWGAGESPAPSFHPDECWGLRRGRPHEVDGGYDPACEHFASTPAGSLCMPMTVHGETLGVLCVSTERPGGLTDRERRAAKAVAEQVSLALANLRLQQALRDRSIRDPLTGLYNRRYLEESLGRELVRSRRHGQPTSVILADVDHFKRFNDIHGHEAGDAVLAEVSKLLLTLVRGEDIVCRYGGEEFCLILPGAPPEVALGRAEEIREAVARLNVRCGNRPLGPVTISAGIASFPEQGEAQLLNVADAALYRAKRAGRNRVEGSGKESRRLEIHPPIDGAEAEEAPVLPPPDPDGDDCAAEALTVGV